MVLGILKSASCFAANSLQLLLVRGGALGEHDRGRDLFAEPVVRHREGDGLRDGRVLEQDLVDLARARPSRRRG